MNPASGLRTLLAPGNRRAIVLFWLCRLFAAWLVAAPLAAVFAGSGIRSYPQGDALLFEPGSVLLVEVVRLELPALVGALRVGLWIALATAVALLFPLVALWVSLAAPARLGWGTLAARSIDHVPAFALLGGLSLGAKALFALVALLFATALSGLSSRMSEPTADGTALALGLATLLGMGAIDLVFDLARAARIRSGVGALAALGVALGVGRRQPLPPALAFYAATGASAGGVLVTAAIVGWLHVERGPARFALAALLHLAMSLALVAVRAWWLRRALSCVPAPGDTPADTVAPPDPTPDPAA
ncbi:MAG TPA: hypothetical protein VKZ49_10425 [Polyangiaceae bacterium]|nr:hypothetical protein [Polyangiaceae bacterium]